MESGDVLYVQDVLDEIEAEVAGSAAIPVSGQVALNPERMAALIERLRQAAAHADALAADESRYRDARRRVEAEGALIVEEARRKAELALDGSRVAQLREEHVQAIIGESRQRGEELITAAYEYGIARMEEVLVRADDAHRLVLEARDRVVVESGGLAQIARGVRRGLFGGILGRRRRAER
jgi:hypothetical protein